MSVKHFDCDTCGAHGKINFKESDDYRTQDIVFCPFCGSDIFEEDEEDYDEE